jgi:hypothetical protein
MNKSNGVALIAAGLAAGVGLSSILSSGLVPQSGQVMEAQTVASPAAQQVQPQKNDRLETERFAFQNVQIARYGGEPPAGVDVAGELYQVTATITNRSNELLIPSFNYNLRDSQGRKFEKAAFLIGIEIDGLRTSDGILSGQTREGVAIGVFDVLPGATGLELGVTDGMFASTQYVSPPLSQQATQPSPQPSTTLVSASPAPASAAPTAAAQPVAFDSLTPCDQLDSLTRAGKSISEFLVSAHRVNDLSKYKSAIASTCPWNNEQLQVADRVINPPVVVVKPRVVRQSSGGSSGGGTVVVREPAAPRWNNCNGIQEPGESYSARCEAAQRENDQTLRNNFMKPLNPIDERPLSSGRPANGYSGSN